MHRELVLGVLISLAVLAYPAWRLWRRFEKNLARELREANRTRQELERVLEETARRLSDEEGDGGELFAKTLRIVEIQREMIQISERRDVAEDEVRLSQERRDEILRNLNAQLPVRIIGDLRLPDSLAPQSYDRGGRRYLRITSETDFLLLSLEFPVLLVTRSREGGRPEVWVEAIEVPETVG